MNGDRKKETKGRKTASDKGRVSVEEGRYYQPAETPEQTASREFLNKLAGAKPISPKEIEATMLAVGQGKGYDKDFNKQFAKAKADTYEWKTTMDVLVKNMADINALSSELKGKLPASVSKEIDSLSQAYNELLSSADAFNKLNPNPEEFIERKDLEGLEKYNEQGLTLLKNVRRIAQDAEEVLARLGELH